jgi:hypothetical protein
VDRYDPPDVPAADRLRDLGAHLRELADRVREAVAEAVGETLGRLARDAARRWLGRPGSIAPRRYPAHQPARRDTDPWADDDPWEETDRPTHPSSADEVADPPAHSTGIGRVLVTGLMWAAGWWLRRRYRTVAAVTTAIAAVTAAAWPAADAPVLDTLGAAAEALTAHQALDTGASALEPN